MIDATVLLLIGVQLAIVGAALALFGRPITRRWPGARAAVIVGRTFTLVAGVALVFISLTSERTPASGVPNPVPNTVASVARGSDLYQANCARCHGSEARGGGPDAGTTQVPPADLRSGHVNEHTDGDIFYWITNGLEGGMPAWGTRLSETQRWELVNYLRSLNNQPVSPATTGTEIGSRASPRFSGCSSRRPPTSAAPHPGPPTCFCLRSWPHCASWGPPDTSFVRGASPADVAPSGR